MSERQSRRSIHGIPTHICVCRFFNLGSVQVARGGGVITLAFSSLAEKNLPLPPVKELGHCYSVSSLYTCFILRCLQHCGEGQVKNDWLESYGGQAELQSTHIIKSNFPASSLLLQSSLTLEPVPLLNAMGLKCGGFGKYCPLPLPLAEVTSTNRKQIAQREVIWSKSMFIYSLLLSSLVITDLCQILPSFL